MARPPTRISSLGRGFFLRLLLGYCVIPLIPPLLLLFSLRADPRSGGEWQGAILIYGLFGLAAMVVLGSPLLFCFIRLGWTGFAAFTAGGGICAGITSYAVLRGSHNLPMIAFFGATGVISGLCFRMILFGFDTKV
jgi:hypothetical protein